MKLLLHCCCGPCAVAVVRNLLDDADVQELAGYFYNPNIQPYQEYKARREAWRQVMEHYGLAAHLDDEYTLESWLRAVAQEPAARCGYCYESRLRRAAEQARELGYEAFTTTLLISPYQRHEEIRAAGEQIAAELGLRFYYRDFRPEFRAGQQMARELELYMQKYCGCIYSEKERYCKQR